VNLEQRKRIVCW